MYRITRNGQQLDNGMRKSYDTAAEAWDWIKRQETLYMAVGGYTPNFQVWFNGKEVAR